MPRLSADTFRRPVDMTDRGDPAVLYVRSYLLIRTVVGLIGILLPIALMIGEAVAVRGSVRLRDSLSVYYHSSMQDLFVGGLCVTAFLLITYLAGQLNTLDFWLSSLAGAALLVVVFFPIWRPGVPAGAPLCGSTPEPPGCSPTEQLFGEAPVAHVHEVAAAVFIVSLAAISFLFARRAQVHEHNGWMAAFHVACGAAILLGAAWAVVGTALDVPLGELTPVYLGEVVAVEAFGVSWLVKGYDLRRILIPRRARPVIRARDREADR